MRVVKPFSLGVLTRCYETGRQFRMGVAVLAFVPIGHEPALLSEMSMWTFASEALPAGLPLDVGIPKVAPEFLVVGQVYTPHGEPQPALQISAMLGAHAKRLYAFGDRYWYGQTASAPQPFAAMPLDWTCAFGGRDDMRNPLGKGIDPIETPGGWRVPLPNLEYPHQAVALPEQRPEPAGFGPIDQTWPQRARLAGTYDDRWLKEDFPGFARDLDWRFFNIASEDQQLAAPLIGDEPLAFENLHPTKPLLRGTLPGLRGRVFVVRRGAERELEEIATRLTTAWCFPDAERLILVFHGDVKLEEEDAADITSIIVAAEGLGAPRTLEHYTSALARRLDPEKGAIAALRESDLVPAELVVPDPLLAREHELRRPEGLVEHHQRRRAEREIAERRAFVASLGLDPDVHAPSPPPLQAEPPSLEELPGYVEQILAEAEAQRQEGERWRAEQDAAIREQMAAVGLDFATVEAERSALPKGPPEFTAKGKRRELRTLAKRCRAMGIDTDELDRILADPAMNKLWEEAEAQARAGYRLTAHLQGPVDPKSEESSAAVRAALAGTRFGGHPIDGTGANLAGLDLAGQDFAGAWLERVCLDGANLAAAKLPGAVLAHASLRGAVLDEADLADANMGAAYLEGASLARATLRGAILAKANLSRVLLIGADLEGADLSEAVLEEADLAEAKAPQLVLHETRLRGLRARGTTLDRAVLIRVDLSGVDLAGASLIGTVFLAARGSGVSFRGARMRNVRFVEQCRLEEVDLSEADLAGANLRGVSLRGCRIAGANLDGADLSEADLSGADLRGVSARGALMVKTTLEGALVSGADLMGAILQRADLRGTDLRHTSLHGADLARVRIDRAAHYEGALMTRMRFLPRLNG